MDDHALGAFGAEISKAVLAAGDKLVATARTMEASLLLGANGPVPESLM